MLLKESREIFKSILAVNEKSFACAEFPTKFESRKKRRKRRRRRRRRKSEQKEREREREDESLTEYRSNDGRVVMKIKERKAGSPSSVIWSSANSKRWMSQLNFWMESCYRSRYSCSRIFIPSLMVPVTILILKWRREIHQGVDRSTSSDEMKLPLLTLRWNFHFQFFWRQIDELWISSNFDSVS